MPAKIIDGNKAAEAILEKVKLQVADLKQKSVDPVLTVILIGDNKASELYIEKKKQACNAVGIEFDLFRFKHSIQQREITDLLKGLNYKQSVHGILVQLPLPQSFDTARVIDKISPLKDVDGFTSFNHGMLSHGKEEIVSCTAQGILKLVEGTGTKLEGSNVCIVNHGIVVGRPLAQLMLNRNATVTICNKATKDLALHTKQADVLVTAVGKPGLIKAGMVKQGAVVIDAGIARLGEKTVGDVDFEAVKEVASFITPVPGGVGPMTVACLMQNVANLAGFQRKV